MGFSRSNPNGVHEFPGRVNHKLQDIANHPNVSRISVAQLSAVEADWEAVADRMAVG